MLPLNPTDVGAVSPALAFNTAVSFVTNTNWQNYGGESTMSHLTQMAGLTVQNFVSAAVGIAVAIALVRGLVRRRSETIGNFWVDLVADDDAGAAAARVRRRAAAREPGRRADAARAAPRPRPSRARAQEIYRAPIASQEAIKELGTNGGGIANANSAHPFENPTAFTNLVEMLALLLIPFALTYAFGRMVGDQRQGWALFAAMFVLWLGSVASRRASRSTATRGSRRSAANMEGKEVRFGAAASALFAASTTGHVDRRGERGPRQLHAGRRRRAAREHDARRGLPGGVGAGLYGMLVFALLAVFIAGLMVGRTPEYLGKKIQAAEMKLVVLYLLVVPTLVLGFAAVSVLLDAAKASILNPGPHGLSEVVYAFTSAANNNGSAFGGLTGNTDWYNTTLGLAMLGGRFLLIVLVLAIAGSLARKQTVPATAGTFPTGTPLFAGPARRRRPDRRRADVLPRARARADRGAAEAVRARTALLDPRDPLARAPLDSVRKLDPRRMARNPVMFVVEIGSVLVTVLAIADPSVFAWLIAAWLWFTVLFANLAEAIAEGRGKAQAEALRKTRAETVAHRRGRDGTLEDVPSGQRASATRWSSSAGEMIPADGEVIEGIASVDESAITGESAPVIRESGGDRSAVTGGTRVLSDQIVVRVTAAPGESFLDRMIALVEGAERQKTPNEIALNILLAGLTIVFLLAVVTLQPFAIYSGAEQSLVVLVALLVCLIPTTIGALLSAIGIAGMDRLVRRNVLALSGRAVEAAGDCSTLLLDKTGTITLGNRQATEFLPLAGVTGAELADAAQLASLADETPEGRSIVVLAKERLRPPRARVRRRRARPVHRPDADERRRHRRAARSARERRTRSAAGSPSRAAQPPAELATIVDRIAPPAARRSSSPKGRARSASSTSRTSSRRACASASTSCGRWGSAR